MVEPEWTTRLRIAFQPIVRLADRSIVGFEALARLTDMEDRLSEEADPLFARRPGLALVVLRRCAPLLAGWRAQSEAARDWWLSVNAGPEELLDGEFAEVFEELRSQQALPAGALRLELTEHSALPDLTLARTGLQRLSSAGASLAIDDFGAGATSLSWLVHLPFDCLKLDRSLTQAAEGGERGRAVARAVAALAHELGAVCIAEGVETASQAETLQRCGCSLAQGYLFGRPMDAAVAPNWTTA